MTSVPDAKPALQVQGLQRSFGSVHALRGVDWTVSGSGIHGLVGPNGAGKTTLFSIICGFLPADAGTVELQGAPVGPNTPPSPGHIGVLPQDAGLPPRQNVGRTLEYYGRLMGMTPHAATVETRRVLELVGLPEVAQRRPRTLSHGMFKRVGIAQAMMGTPPIVLLDEPTAGLDPNAAREVRSLLRDLRSEGTIVVSSHNLAEIEDLCTEVAILNEGLMVRQDSVETLVGAAHQVSFRLTGTPPPECLAGLRALECTTDVEWDAGSDRLKIFVDPAHGTAAESSGALIAELSTRNVAFLELQIGATLEERFTEETS